MIGARAAESAPRPGRGSTPLVAVLCGVLAALAGACTERAPATARAGALSVHHVIAPSPIATGDERERTMSVYFAIENSGGEEDTLTGVETPFAAMAMLHRTESPGNLPGMPMAGMTMLDALVVPAHGTVRLAPGATHIMLEGLKRHYVDGDSLPLVLLFRRAGRLPLMARVVTYGALDSLLDRPRRP